MKFQLSDICEKFDEIDKNGKKYGKVPAITWFTNIPNNKKNKPLDLYRKYNPTEYPKYDNYDAIEVSKVADIPQDYDGVMGVPITFLGKYCDTQFEIVKVGVTKMRIRTSGNFNSKQSINLQNAEDNERRYHCSESQQFALRYSGIAAKNCGRTKSKCY